MSGVLGGEAFQLDQRRLELLDTKPRPWRRAARLALGQRAQQIYLGQALRQHALPAAVDDAER